MMDLERSHAEFPVTQWTLVDALQDETHPQHREAMATLLGRYWPPIYAYLRRTGKLQEEATELTQAFFADVVLQRGLFEHAQPHRGRLRALLLSSLKRFLRDRVRRGSARRAGMTISLEQLEREDAIAADDPSGDVQEAFERRWAMLVLEEALRRCGQHFRSTGRQRHWAAFEAYVLRPSITMSRPMPLATVAREAGFESAEAVAGALRTVRKRAMTLLREVVAETATDREDREAEYRLVVSLLG